MTLIVHVDNILIVDRCLLYANGHNRETLKIQKKAHVREHFAYAVTGAFTPGETPAIIHEAFCGLSAIATDRKHMGLTEQMELTVGALNVFAIEAYMKNTPHNSFAVFGKNSCVVYCDDKMIVASNQEAPVAIGSGSAVFIAIHKTKQDLATCLEWTLEYDPLVRGPFDFVSHDDLRMPTLADLYRHLTVLEEHDVFDVQPLVKVLARRLFAETVEEMEPDQQAVVVQLVKEHLEKKGPKS